MFRLNALIDLLLWEGEDYDPAIARELFEALPPERSSWLEVNWLRNRRDKGFEGLTNIGTVSTEDRESKKERVTFGAPCGTWIGKWRVIRMKRDLVIEPRFFGQGDEDGNSEYFVLPFKYGEPQILYKSVPMQIRIPIPFLGTFYLTLFRLVKWKSPAVSKVSQG